MTFVMSDCEIVHPVWEHWKYFDISSVFPETEAKYVVNRQPFQFYSTRFSFFVVFFCFPRQSFIFLFMIINLTNTLQKIKNAV